MASLLRGGCMKAFTGQRSLHALAYSRPAVSLLQPSRCNSPMRHQPPAATLTNRHWTSWLGGGTSSSSSASASSSEELRDTSPSYGVLGESQDSSSLSSVDAVSQPPAHAETSSSIVDGATAASTAAPDVAATAGVAKSVFTGPALSSSSWYYAPMATIQSFVLYLHVTQHLPIWACIGATALVLRLTVSPIQVKVLKVGAVLQSNMPQLNDLQMRIMMATKRHDAAAAEALQRESEELFDKMGCSPWSAMRYSLAMTPFQLSCFFALRDLCLGMGAVAPGDMTTGGFLWVPDLTVPDPYFVLPVMLSSVFLTAMFTGSESGMRPSGMMRHVLIGLSVAGVALTSQFPAGIQLFWLFNISLGVALARCYRLPVLRRLLGIPERVQNADVKPGMDAANLREVFSSKPPGPQASFEQRAKFIAKGVDEKLKVDEKQRAVEGSRFKGLEAGLAAAKKRQAEKRRDES